VTRLRQRQLERRIAKVEGAFRRLGHVDVERQTGSPQTIVITIAHPGWGAPTTAQLSFVETWILEGGLWALTKYAYDLLLRRARGDSGSIGTTAGTTSTASTRQIPAGTITLRAVLSTSSLPSTGSPRSSTAKSR
jgi:hypothetical protein